MMDFSLEEDIPEEFKGTLTLNGDKQTPTRSDNTAGNQIATNNNGWSSGLITSIPHRISEGLFSKKEKEEEKDRQVVQQVATPVIENPNEFFTFREGVVERAVRECSEQFLNDEEDGPLLAYYLLTQINIWDTDKERLLLITPKTLVIVKYDFIALKRLDYKKLPLEIFDTILIGDLVYPPGSLAPHINGIVEDISNVLQSCVFDPWSKGEGRSLSTLFQPRSRNTRGIRLMWNKSRPLDFKTKWNPFSNNIPFCTFTFHPLYFHKECDEEKQKLYDLDLFIENICSVATELQRSKANNEETCIIHHKEIVLENYFGVGSAIHNQNLLGFFKVRGKFSF